MTQNRFVLVAAGFGLAVSSWLTPSVAIADNNIPDYVRAYIAAHSGPVPSYARQTGLACSACHYQYLALTPFGRKFKLEGYVLSNQAAISETDSSSGGKLDLSPYSLLSAMASASLTHTQDVVEDTQNDAAALPQELSLFLAGRVTSKVGVFSQFTYAGADGSIGIDNVDLRFANKTAIGNTEVIYGVTLHNSPTVQDLWNTTPVWGFPFIGSEGTPAGAASTLIDEGLAQNALGLGAYTLIGDLVYGEFTVYRSAFQGAAAPSSETGAIDAVAPYWRIALQKSFGDQYLMVGTFGLRASIFPDVLTGPHDIFTDVGVDGQFESKMGTGNIVLRGAWVHERQALNATFAGGDAANARNTLETLRANASYYPSQWLGLSAGYFQTTGTVDDGLYAPGPVVGSANGDPKTNGLVGEVDLNPWENARVGAQYVAYSRFNGLSTNYDGFNRNASGNNTLFLFVWLAF